MINITNIIKINLEICCIIYYHKFNYIKIEIDILNNSLSFIRMINLINIFIIF